MAIGIMSVLFVGMSVFSVLGLLLMYLLKNEKAKAVCFYCMSVWGMAIAAISATSLPSNFTAAQIAAWAIGFLSVIGLLIHIRAKSDSQLNAAYILTTISVIAGILNLFVF